MRKMILAAATALSVAAMPAIAKSNQSGDLNAYYGQMSAEQQEAWAYMTADQRMAMWQAETKNAADDSWDAIITKVNDVQASGEELAYTTERGTREADAQMQMAYVQRPVVQEVTFADASDPYPVCRSDLDDHCMNAWAAGMRGPGVDRPLGYWPGESVTETRSGG